MANKDIALLHLVDGDAFFSVLRLAEGVTRRNCDQVFDRLLCLIFVGGVDEPPQFDKIDDDRTGLEIKTFEIGVIA